MYIRSVITPVSSTFHDFSFTEARRKTDERLSNENSQGAVREATISQGNPKTVAPEKLDASKNIKINDSPETIRPGSPADIQQPKNLQKFDEQKQDIQTDVNNQEIHRDFVQKEERKLENRNAEQKELQKEEQTANEVNENLRRTESRKKFFEDLSRLEQRQEKLSQLFKAQTDIAFIGKHANLTA
jgi:hypothetical protein